MTKASSARLEGLDLARFLAFVGMVIVNFKIVMGADGGTGGLADAIGLLEGKAAATFVVLAGVGLGLSAGRSTIGEMRKVTARRALFLLVIGLLNTLIFDADILHYYAFYFLFGMFCLNMKSGHLLYLTGTVVIGFVVLALVLDYDAGWNWADYTYPDFWSPVGFVRNLFFNGWHPVLPWLAFFLFGIAVSRWQIGQAATQMKMLCLGSVIALMAGLLSWGAVAGLDATDPEQMELATLFLTAPVPPAPLFMVMGMSVATVVISLCLLIARAGQGSWLFGIFTAPGRQTLTLYVAHILLGMGVLDELNLLGAQNLSTSVMASLYFCAAATIYAVIWGRFFKRGPIEMLMRKLAG